MKVVVVIPAYRAEQTVAAVIRDVRAQGLPVIVVDDGSSDGTADAAEHAGAAVIRRRVNGGKGAALREGLASACRQGYDWIVTMDADGQHLASEVPAFLREAEGGQADLVLGNRMNRPRGMPLDRRVTNWFMSALLSRATGEELPDTQCGFRAVSRRLLESVRLCGDRFEIESELVLRAARAGFRIQSVPVTSVYRRQISFIRPIRDTVRFARLLLTQGGSNRNARAGL